MKEYSSVDNLLIKTAQLVRTALSPYTIPLGSFAALFLFSYLHIMPLPYKLVVLGIIFCFTVMLPVSTIFLFRKLFDFDMPALFICLSYAGCFLMMRKLHIPGYMTGIILASFVAAVAMCVANLIGPSSESMAGVGGVIGGLVSFSVLFNYNPVWYLCVFILAAGVLGSAGIILNRHGLGGILSGFAIGLACSVLVLHPGCNALFRPILF